MIMPWDDPEAKAQKKFNRVMRNAILSVGIGIGLLLIKPFFLGTEEGASSDSTAKLFSMLGFSLISYGAVIVASGLLLKKQVLKINLIAFYIVLPIIILKALADWQG